MPPRRVDDPGVVAADAREVVLQRTQPGRSAAAQSPGQRGHVGARHPADVPAHRAGERAEPGLLRELGHRVDGAAHLAARRARSPAGVLEARPVAAAVASTAAATSPANGATALRRLPGRADRAVPGRRGPARRARSPPRTRRRRPVAVRRRGRAGRRRRRRPRRPGGPARRARPAPAVGRVGRHAVGRHRRASRGGEPGELAAAPARSRSRPPDGWRPARASSRRAWSAAARRAAGSAASGERSRASAAARAAGSSASTRPMRGAGVPLGHRRAGRRGRRRPRRRRRRRTPARKPRAGR